MSEEEEEEEEIDVDDMRYELAEQEAMNMNVADVVNLLIEGYEGLDNISDIDIIEEYNKVFKEKRKKKK